MKCKCDLCNKIHNSYPELWKHNKIYHNPIFTTDHILPPKLDNFKPTTNLKYSNILNNLINYIISISLHKKNMLH
jgi:hypothetical protein